jgi:uncharacterized surface protein with fasciclin (FAS1) repeats
MKNVVETAIEAGNFKTLVRAVQETGLGDILSGEGPFTVFAPTDEAFSKLPARTLENLLQDKEKLTEILTYHVVPNKVMSSDISTIANAITVQGNKLSIDSRHGVKVNNVNVTKPDIECTNGVIHIIDEVLIPE